MTIRIGIDFDNTIVNYDNVFQKLATNFKLIKSNWFGSKQELRKKIIREKNEATWMKLQGLAYGQYMHLAEINKGVESFLLQSKLLGADIFIVSHKTKYGHYDKGKTLLRDVALNWILKKKLNFNKVYFENSIDEKIKRINSLKLNYFIDDLQLILNNKKFSNQTKKILYNKIKNTHLRKNISQFYKWCEIKNFVFGNENFKQIKIFAEYISKKKIRKIVKIKGQRNSKLFKVFFKDGMIGALKKYPDIEIDNRERLKREYLSLKLLKKSGINHISEPMYKNEILNIVIFKWINGGKISNPSHKHLEISANFIKSIKKISYNKVKLFPFNAVESCKSLKDILDQIHTKFKILEKVKSNPKRLKNLLQLVIRPTFKRICTKTASLKFSKFFIKPINKKHEILSPSDFGFHNSIKTSKDKVIFLDFEYFGKDDPVKLVADFLLHPGMSLSNSQKKFWLNKVVLFFTKDKNFKKRLNFYIPFYAIRWSLIVLNDFKISNINQHCKNIKMNKSTFLKNRKKQINKSLYFCNLVKNKGYAKWLN